LGKENTSNGCPGETMNKQVTQDDIIYFVMTDRFFGRHKRTVEGSDASIHGGTLDGIIAKLDYLLELGVTTIWLTPVYENFESHGSTEPYHGYWPLEFERIDPRLLDGSHLPRSPDMPTFGKFVDVCEARGMKIVLDMVVNPAGYGADEGFDPTWFNVEGSGDIKGNLAGLPDFNFDVDGMLACVHPDIEFKNVSNGVVTTEANGIDALRRLADQSKALFWERKQSVLALESGDDEATVSVAFRAVVAIDLPNGMRKGQGLNLTGRSELRFAGGKVRQLMDSA
jgi:hypothetical protein